MEWKTVLRTFWAVWRLPGALPKSGTACSTVTLAYILTKAAVPLSACHHFYSIRFCVQSLYQINSFHDMDNLVLDCSLETIYQLIIRVFHKTHQVGYISNIANFGFPYIFEVSSLFANYNAKKWEIRWECVLEDYILRLETSLVSEFLIVHRNHSCQYWQSNVS